MKLNLTQLFDLISEYDSVVFCANEYHKARIIHDAENMDRWERALDDSKLFIDNLFSECTFTDIQKVYDFLRCVRRKQNKNISLLPEHHVYFLIARFLSTIKTYN